MTSLLLAGTGHRPDKLGGYEVAAEARRLSFACDVLEALRPRALIVGMALGWDQVLARVGHVMGIPFDAYIPFVGQEKAWPLTAQRLYHELLEVARCVVVCSAPGYSPIKMQVRNERMVQAGEAVLALWNGSPGGTANCVRYAEKLGKPVINVWDKWTMPWSA